MSRESGLPAVRLSVTAKPRAKRSRIVQANGTSVAVALAALPVDGQANDMLVRLLAEVLEVPRAQIALVRGASARRKLVDVDGLPEAEIVARLAAASSAR